MRSQKKVPQQAAVLLACLLFGSLLLCAGIRAPGLYNGVVVFDRWDNCYLYSGERLMYVSTSVREGLRDFAGRFVLLDAQEVYQPINPGDGRINRYGAVVPDRAQSHGFPTEGVALALQPEFDETGAFSVLLTVTNHRDEPLTITLEYLAVTVFGRIKSPLMPSDGGNHAVISSSIRTLYNYSPAKAGFRGTSEGGSESWNTYSARILETPATRKESALKPGAKRTFPIQFQLPGGEYDLIAGYGGAVHSTRLVVSNMLAFDVDGHGKVQLVPVPGRD